MSQPLVSNFQLTPDMLLPLGEYSHLDYQTLFSFSSKKSFETWAGLLYQALVEAGCTPHFTVEMDGYCQKLVISRSHPTAEAVVAAFRQKHDITES